MKIAIATSVYYPMINGVAMFSYNLATGLVRQGHEVLVLTPSQTKRKHTETMGGVKVVYLKSNDIKVYPDQIHQIEKKKLFYKDGFKASLFPGRQIKKALKKFQPDVIHIQGSDPIGLAAYNYAHKNHIPLVATEHNQPEVLTESLPLPGVVKKPVNSILSAYFSNRQSKSDYATMPTKLAIENLNHGKKLNVPIEAVSNGVNLEFFGPRKPNPKILQKYQLPKDVPILLYVGRLDPEKNIEVVVRAFGKFLDKHKLDELSKTLFVLVGDGVDRSRLVELSEKMKIRDSVKFLGRVTGDDLPEIYRAGRIFLTASEIETQGIVLIEAAASGLPLIAVDAGAVAEICQDKINGFLLKPGDIDGMVEAMSTLLTDLTLRRKMSKASLEIAKEHSLDKTIDKFLEIYRKVINGVQKT